MRTIGLLSLLIPGCLPDLDKPDDTAPVETDTDTDADSDTDSDTDADADSDADADADSDTDADPGFDCGTAPIPMVEIAAGDFRMGSPTSEVGRADDETQHWVTLTHDYCLGTYEVRQTDWDAWMTYTVGYFDDCGSNCPVESVSWHEAAAFANALSAAEHAQSCYTCTGSGSSIRCEPAINPYTCDGYRLPTEAEWERAARAGDDAAFPEDGELYAGDQASCLEDTELTNGDAIRDFAWWCGSSDETIHPAGHLDPNPWGLHDLHGNVYEWCHDGHDDYDGDETDPTGPASASRRVLRGGSFAVPGGSLRAAKRNEADPDLHLYVYGFRLARTVR